MDNLTWYFYTVFDINQFDTMVQPFVHFISTRNLTDLPLHLLGSTKLDSSYDPLGSNIYFGLITNKKLNNLEINRYTLSVDYDIIESDLSYYRKINTNDIYENTPTTYDLLYDQTDVIHKKYENIDQFNMTLPTQFNFMCDYSNNLYFTKYKNKITNKDIKRCFYSDDCKYTYNRNANEHEYDTVMSINHHCIGIGVPVITI